jgi:hypothetical protein
MQSLLNTSILIKREPSINLCRHFPRHNRQNLLSELHQEPVEGGVDLLIEILAVVLAVRDRDVHELGVLSFLGCREDQRWVGGCILGLVFSDRWGMLGGVVGGEGQRRTCEITCEVVSSVLVWERGGEDLPESLTTVCIVERKNQ